jgi:hypothetical protein
MPVRYGIGDLNVMSLNSLFAGNPAAESPETSHFWMTSATRQELRD